MFGSGFSQAQILANVQQRLMLLRAACEAVTDLEGWASGVAASDLEAIGFSSSDASELLSAIADAAAVAQVYGTGQPPGTYPQASSAYVYAASQRQVIGPQ